MGESVALRVHVVKGKAPAGWQGFPSGSGSSGRWRLLHPQDGILSEQDQDLPFCRHVVGACKLIQIVEHPVSVVFMRAEEVVVGDPEGDAVVGAIKVVVAAGSPVREFESAVESFHDLFEWTELFGDCIFIGKPDDLRDVEFEILAVIQIELLSGKRIGGIAIGNEAELLRKFSEVLQSHTHGQDAGTDTAIRRDTVAKNGTGSSIHDEPDETFDTLDLDVSLVTDHIGRRLVVIGIHERFDDKGCSSGIVSDLLVRDADAIEIVHSLSGLAKGQLQIDMESQTQGHDVGIVLGEIQRRSVLRKAGQIHFEEIDLELPVDVMEFVSVLFERMFLVDFLQIPAVVGALRIDAFVDAEAGTVLDRNKDVTAVRALVFDRLGVDTAIDECGAADLAPVLPVTAVVIVKVLIWSTADRADLILRDRTAITMPNRFDLLAVFVFVVGDQEFPVLFEEGEDVRKPVDPELLVLRRFGIIMDPLTDGYEFTDKLQQKCDLFGLMLNDVKKIEYNVHEQLDPFTYGFCGKNIVPEKGVIALFFAEKARTLGNTKVLKELVV